MAQNYDPQDSNKEDYGIKDYYQQGGQTPPYETPKAKPDPYGSLEPPASNIFAKWVKVITRPSTATFASEMRDANWGTTLLGALIYAIVYFVVVAFTTRSVGFFIGSAIVSVPTVVTGLFLGSGFLYLLAKTIGHGEGDFMTQTYLYSLYTFPLAIISSLLGIIPLVGSVVSLAIGIFELFLTYYMLQPAHRMSASNARTVVLVSLLIGLVLGFILFFALLNFILSAKVSVVMSQAASGLGP